MGCFGSKTASNVARPVEKFSWDKEDRPDPKDFMVSGQTSGVHGRIPGQVKGQQFVIEDCLDCAVYLYDVSAMVTVDNCERCQLFIGPVKGSLFLRNCKDIKLVAACQQFRSRDCRKIDVFLLSSTQPIIESSSSMKFGCFQYYYPELADQLQEAGLSVFNNSWSNIHDFTPVAEHSNWSLLPESANVDDYLPRPPTEEFACVDIETDPKRSVVPATRGGRHALCDEICFVAFFAEYAKLGKPFVNDVIQNKGCYLNQTKEIVMSDEDIKRIFSDQHYGQFSVDGPVVGLEVCGAAVINKCEEAARTLGMRKDKMYISNCQDAAHKDVKAFYKFIDMTMS